MKKRIEVTIVLLSILLFTACGGGGDTDPSIGWVRIDLPTMNDTYQTNLSMINLQGASFVPEGSSCPAIIGELPSG